MSRSLKDHLAQCKSHAGMIYGQRVEVSGEHIGYLCIVPLFLWNCVRVNKAVTMGAVEQRLWQRDTDWDVVVAERPNWLLALPAVAPGLSLTDTLGHFLCVSVRTDIRTLPGECLQPHADSY